MRQAERLEAILEWLSGNGSLNVANIADELGVSAAINVNTSPASSCECMILSRSAGSSLAPNSPNVFMVSSPPNTDW